MYLPLKIRKIFLGGIKGLQEELAKIIIISSLKLYISKF